MSDASRLTGHLWTERLRTEGAEVLASYAAGVLAGLPAVTRHSFGAGAAWYTSTLLAADDLTALLRGIAAATGLLPASAASAPDPGGGAPPGVSVTRRHDGQGRSWLCAVSHSTVPVTLSASGLDLITGRQLADALDLPPYGIAVIRERTAPSGPA